MNIFFTKEYFFSRLISFYLKEINGLGGAQSHNSQIVFVIIFWPNRSPNRHTRTDTEHDTHFHEYGLSKCNVSGLYLNCVNIKKSKCKAKATLLFFPYLKMLINVIKTWTDFFFVSLECILWLSQLIIEVCVFTRVKLFLIEMCLFVFHAWNNWSVKCVYVCSRAWRVHSLSKAPLIITLHNLIY